MELAFPCLFPYGQYGFSSTRNTKLHLYEYIQHCYFWNDRRFRTHPLFLFWAYNRL